MGVGPRGPKIPPQAVDLERQTARSTPMKPLTRRILYGVLAVMAVGVVAAFVWIFLPD
jgi:hypothetical protein